MPNEHSITVRLYSKECAAEGQTCILCHERIWLKAFQYWDEIGDRPPRPVPDMFVCGSFHDALNDR